MACILRCYRYTWTASSWPFTRSLLQISQNTQKNSIEDAIHAMKQAGFNARPIYASGYAPEEALTLSK